jgi:hypothetical protein
MDTINLMSELTPAHFLMFGLGLQMVALLAMWLVGEALPAKSAAAIAGLIPQPGAAQIVRVEFRRARPARGWAAASYALERHAA